MPAGTEGVASQVSAAKDAARNLGHPAVFRVSRFKSKSTAQLN